MSIITPNLENPTSPEAAGENVAETVQTPEYTKHWTAERNHITHVMGQLVEDGQLFRDEQDGTAYLEVPTEITGPVTASDHFSFAHADYDPDRPSRTRQQILEKGEAPLTLQFTSQDPTRPDQHGGITQLVIFRLPELSRENVDHGATEIIAADGSVQAADISLAPQNRQTNIITEPLIAAVPNGRPEDIYAVEIPAAGDVRVIDLDKDLFYGSLLKEITDQIEKDPPAPANS